MKKLITKIKDKLKEKEMKRAVYGAIIDEIIPVFHDSFETSNKEFLEIEQNSPLLKNEKYLSKLESQNGVLVKFKEGFEYLDFGEHYGDPHFTKEGFVQEMKFKIHNAGYFRSKDLECKVVLVTDRFVYYRNLEEDYIDIISYNEIKEMMRKDSLEFF